MLSAAISSSSRNTSETLVKLRRLFVVITVLALLWPFARPLLAETLVERALGVMVLGDYATAGTYVNRAMWLDPDVADVVDANAFLVTFGSNESKLRATQVALGTYLSTHPADVNARWDRMLLEMRLSEYKAAYADQRVIQTYEPQNKQIHAVGSALRERLARR